MSQLFNFLWEELLPLLVRFSEYALTFLRLTLADLIRGFLSLYPGGDAVEVPDVGWLSYSALEFMFGAGLLTYLGVQIWKWIKGIIF